MRHVYFHDEDDSTRGYCWSSINNNWLNRFEFWERKQETRLRMKRKKNQIVWFRICNVSSWKRHTINLPIRRIESDTNQPFFFCCRNVYTNIVFVGIIFQSLWDTNTQSITVQLIIDQMSETYRTARWTHKNADKFVQLTQFDWHPNWMTEQYGLRPRCTIQRLRCSSSLSNEWNWLSDIRMPCSAVFGICTNTPTEN